MQVHSSQIKIDLEGVPLDVADKWRQDIAMMITQGVFSIKSGKVTLSFDHSGTMQDIRFDYTQWKRKYS